MGVIIDIYGPRRAGKNTLMRRLQTARFQPSVPSIEMKRETIQIRGKEYTGEELTPQSTLVREWILKGIRFRTIQTDQHFFLRAIWDAWVSKTGCVGFLYTFDISDPKQYPEARDSLWRTLRMHHLKEIPLVVFVNKADLADPVIEAKTVLGLTHEVPMFRISAKTGQGIREGLRALVDQIKQANHCSQAEIEQLHQFLEYLERSEEKGPNEL